MQVLNKAELAFLAAIGYPELTAKVLKLYANGTYLFTDTFCPHLNIMWTSYMKLLRRYKKEYGLNLNPDIIAAGLAETLQSITELPEELVSRCNALLLKYTSKDIPDMVLGTKLIVNLVKLDTNRQIMTKINANSDLLELQKSLDKSKEMISALEPAEKANEDEIGVVCRPLQKIDKLAVHIDQVPTGINWLDEVSSGGGRAGELWLIMGAPGSGKSVLTVQYACAQALLGNYTMWATYEQAIEGDLSERMIANITDTSLDVIRNKGFNNLPKELQDKYWSCVDGISDRLISVDMTKHTMDDTDPLDYGGVGSIIKEYNELKEQGAAPKTIIVDWFGFMMSKIAGNKHYDLSSNYRFIAQHELGLANEFVRQEKMLMIFLHQLDVKAAGARPTYLANATQSQDMHNMQNYFSLVMVLGNRDINNILYFSSPKARRAERVVRTLRLIGDKARFVMEPGWLPNRDGNFYKPGATVNTDDIGHIASTYMREID